MNRNFQPAATARADAAAESATAGEPAAPRGPGWREASIPATGREPTTVLAGERSPPGGAPSPAREPAVEELAPPSLPGEKRPAPAPQRVEKVSVRLAPRAIVTVLDEGRGFKDARGVGFDPVRREVYVCDTGHGLIAVLDPAGELVTTLGYGARLKEPTGVAVDRDGRIFVIEGAPRRLTILDFRGDREGPFPYRGLEASPAPEVTAVATDADGRIYIADRARGEVLVFGPDLALERRFGKRNPDAPKGDLDSVVAIAPGGRRTYVMNATGTSIRAYDAGGRYQYGFGQHEVGPGNFSLPIGLAVDGDGRLIAADMIRQQVTVFEADGKVLGGCGGLGSRPGEVAFPSGIACDGNGRVFVLERTGARLQILEREEVRTVVAAAAPSSALAQAEGSRAEDDRERVRASLQSVLGAMEREEGGAGRASDGTPRGTEDAQRRGGARR